MIRPMTELGRCEAIVITRALGKGSLWVRDNQCPSGAVMPVNGRWCCALHYEAATVGPRSRGEARPVEFVREL